ncbi:MAG: hypothetical protein ACOYN0_10250 [Phycisphaerales bacterium]
MIRSFCSAAVLAAFAGLACAQAPTPIVPPGTDIFGNPTQGPGMFPITLSASTWGLQLPGNTVNGRFGSNALVHTFIYSGPYAWTAGNTNEGDIDCTIGVANPSDPRAYPTFAGYDAFRETDASIASNPLPAALPLPASQWPDSENWGRIRLTGGLQLAPANWAWGTNPAVGVMMVTPAANGRDNRNFDRFDRVTPMGTFYAHAHVTDDGGDSTGRGYNPITGELRGTGLYASCYVVGDRPGEQDEAVIDFSAAYFPYAQGWIGGFYDDSTTNAAWRTRNYAGTSYDCASPGLVAANTVTLLDAFDARHHVTIPNGSPELGMLLAQNCNDTNESNLMGVLPANGGWDLAQRYDSDLNQAGNVFAPGGGDARFAFVYVPYNSCNLVGGQVNPNGTLAHSAGDFTITHPSAGVYEIAIPGGTKQTGALIVTSCGSLPGDATLPDRAFYSYEYNATRGVFVVQSREAVPGTNTFNESYPLRDAGFYFMWIDFAGPASPRWTCAADYDRSGGVDGDDVIAFFADWDAGRNCADVDASSGVDGDDVIVFFGIWDISGC